MRGRRTITLSGRRVARAAAVLAAACLLTGLAVAPASVDQPGVDLQAWIHGTSVSSFEPVILSPDENVPITVQVTNHTGTPLPITSVRLFGRVVGLTLFSYPVTVDLQVPPGSAESQSFAVDLSDLDRRAIGLIPATLQLLGPQPGTIVERSFPVEVQGSLASTYGVFGGVALLATLLLTVLLLVGLATGRLEDNRWGRAMEFLVPGIGLGLSLTIALSAVDAVEPSPGHALTLVTLTGIAAAFLGYVSPGRLAPDWDGAGLFQPSSGPAAPAASPPAGATAAATAGTTLATAPARDRSAAVTAASQDVYSRAAVVDWAVVEPHPGGPDWASLASDAGGSDWAGEQPLPEAAGTAEPTS